jgi:type I restriction enzyme, S subunit
MSVRLPDHLDLIAAAPAGIQKLRGLILELAVRGKLVPQDPNDEPASELLKRIARDGSPDVGENEQPFAIPDTWKWVRFDALFSLEYGDNLPAPKRTNTGEFPVYGSNGIVGSHSKCCVTQPCIVVGRKGSAGALNLCLHSGCWVTDVAYYCIPPAGIDLGFCFKLFHTLGLDDLGKGIKPGLSRSEAYEIPVAIPPLAEQRRIVAKVDELMALCDRLEAEQTDAGAVHARLVATLLGTLTQSADAADLAANCQRLAEHFDTLFTTEASLDALKQTILQLAVMGKLVPQDPNDEPASELLKRIAKERARLETEGARRKLKPVLPVGDEEQALSLPSGWKWSRFSAYAIDVSTGPFGSMLHQADYVLGGIPLVNPSHMIGGRIVPENHVAVAEAKAMELSNYRLQDGDIVMARRGEVGRTALVTRNEDGWLCGTGSFVIRLASEAPRRFIVMLFRAASVRRYLGDEAVGTTMVNLNHGILNNMPVAIPPLAEQHRIVAKVDELMALVDRLKADLAESRTQQERLAATLIETALQAA